MAGSSNLVSPKQMARAIGVSESSVKRWCDQGRIKTVRTAGGHRKMPIADVLDFVRAQNHTLVSSEVLGLPPVSDHANLGLERANSRLVEALLAGDESLARQIVFDLYMAKHPLTAIFDDVIAAAFHEIGDRWACNDADVYQERRGCEIALHIIFDLRRVQRSPSTNWTATGGTIEGDLYSLPSAMAELVLREAGFNATSLGTSIPFESLVTAVQDTRPNLFWLSISHIQEGLDFFPKFAALSRTCTEAGTALVVGGRALSEEVRTQMSYSAFCDTMQHLDGFARTLGTSLKQSERAALPTDEVSPGTPKKQAKTSRTTKPRPKSS